MGSYLSLTSITKKTNQQRVMLGKANQHAGEDINVCASAAEINMEVPQEAKSRLLSYDLGISLLGRHLHEFQVSTTQRHSQTYCTIQEGRDTEPVIHQQQASR